MFGWNLRMRKEIVLQRNVCGYLQFGQGYLFAIVGSPLHFWPDYMSLANMLATASIRLMGLGRHWL